MQLMDANTMHSTQIANFAPSGVLPEKLGSTEYTMMPSVESAYNTAVEDLFGLVSIAPAN